MFMKIKSLSEIIIQELPSKGNGDYFDDLHLNLYTNEPLLLEAHELEKIAFPYPDLNKYPDCPWSSSYWHGCNIFGWKYTCGRINDMSPDKLDKMWKQYYREKLGSYKNMKELTFQLETLKPLFYENVLRPLQRTYLKDIQERYLSYDIIASLLALDIDPVKFWYAILWLMDFINDRTDCVFKYEQTPLEGLVAMSKQLNELHADDFLSLYDRGGLTLKIGDAHSLKVTNVDTLRILGKIIDEYLAKYKDKEESLEYMELINRRCAYEDISSDNIFEWKEKRETPSDLMRIYLFHKYMAEYLSRYKGERNLRISDLITDVPKVYAENNASIDKELLISRLLWVFKFDRKGQFYNDNKAVKTALRKFKPKTVEPIFYTY